MGVGDVEDVAVEALEADELLASMNEGRLFGMGAAVDRLVELDALRPDLDEMEAKEAVWLLGGLEPWLLAKRRGWPRNRYEQWFLTCAISLILPP